MLANHGSNRVAVFTLSGTDGVKRLIVNDNFGSIAFAKDISDTIGPEHRRFQAENRRSFSS